MNTQEEETYNNWIEDNRQSLEYDFQCEYADEWSCEEQLMTLMENGTFDEWAEEKFNDDIRNGVI